MLLHKQCCTLLQSKRLIELGTTGHSLYAHNLLKGIRGSYFGVSDTPAFTTAELGEMLTEFPVTKFAMPYYDTIMEEGKPDIYWWLVKLPYKCAEGKFYTEAQARAALLIDILEHNKTNT